MTNVKKLTLMAIIAAFPMTAHAAGDRAAATGNHSVLNDPMSSVGSWDLQTSSWGKNPGYSSNMQSDRKRDAFIESDARFNTQDRSTLRAQYNAWNDTSMLRPNYDNRNVYYDNNRN